MTSYSFRLLQHQPMRTGFTIGGIALCVVLMLFLLSVYRGVADGSVEYIRQNKADLWVLQGNTTNILRGTSILSRGHGAILEQIPGIRSASPILFVLTTIQREDIAATVYLAGYDRKSGLGAPPRLTTGRQVDTDDEIVLDQSFASKFKFTVGDRVILKEDTLKVVGLSAETNMFVIQYAFVTLTRAQLQIGYPGLVTCYLVQIEDGVSNALVKRRIRDELPGLEIYEHQEFLQNNIREMESGFLPLLYSIAGIGVIVLTTILSLILSISILERRKDFAVMKTLGSPRRFLARLVINQGLLISTAACVLGVLLFYPLVTFIESVSPEVNTKSSLEHVALVVLAVWGMSLVSALPTIRRLRRIYPLEVFS